MSFYRVDAGSLTVYPVSYRTVSVVIEGVHISAPEIAVFLKADKYGLLNLNSGSKLYFNLVSKWAKHNEKLLIDEITSNPNFNLTGKGIIKQVNHKKHKYLPVGDCLITLDKDKFTLSGVIGDKPISKEFSTSLYPTMPFSPGKYFELQDGTDVYRIELLDGKQTIKWAVALKIFYRLKKGGNFLMHN